jgi:hypothetical protein
MERRSTWSTGSLPLGAWALEDGAKTGAAKTMAQSHGGRDSDRICQKPIGEELFYAFSVATLRRSHQPSGPAKWLTISLSSIVYNGTSIHPITISADREAQVKFRFPDARILLLIASITLIGSVIAFDSRADGPNILFIMTNQTACGGTRATN